MYVLFVCFWSSDYMCVCACTCHHCPCSAAQGCHHNGRGGAEQQEQLPLQSAPPVFHRGERCCCCCLPFQTVSVGNFSLLGRYSIWCPVYGVSIKRDPPTPSDVSLNMTNRIPFSKLRGKLPLPVFQRLPLLSKLSVGEYRCSYCISQPRQHCTYCSPL